jgi:16S rRNA (guanine527-N7)-methyltransferase
MTESSAKLSEKGIETLLQPYILPGISVPSELYSQLTTYLELLLKWNARTNLTAIREPEEIVRRHFGESLFAAQHLGHCETLLDFGSGAGFPGLPIQLMRPEIHVTLAESQNKKATFLREVIRTLGLKTGVWAGRVEAMPTGSRFDVVTLRAVDNMEAAIAAASSRIGRQMMLLTTARHAPPELAGFVVNQSILLPRANDQQLLSLVRSE